MKLYFNTRKLILLLGASPVIQIVSSDKHPTVIIHNHITGSSAQASTQNQIFQEQSSAQTLTSFYDAIKKTAPSYYDRLLQHKYAIITVFICAGFVYIQHILYHTHCLLQKPTSWCNWKPTASIQQLVCTPYEELIPSLLTDIQKKYVLTLKTTTSHCAISSLDQFIKDVSNELELLQWFATCQKYAKILHISKLFYFAYKKSVITEKINRLHVMLDIFISWQTKELLK